MLSCRLPSSGEFLAAEYARVSAQKYAEALEEERDELIGMLQKSMTDHRDLILSSPLNKLRAYLGLSREIEREVYTAIPNLHLFCDPLYLFSRASTVKIKSFQAATKELLALFLGQA